MKEAIRVIIVEQQSLIQKTLAKAVKLEPRLQIVDYAVNGYEAITKVITKNPDAILMNVDLETKMAGIFVCNEINLIKPDIKVVLYGMECTKEVIFKAFQKGAVDLLVDKYTESELIESIINAFDERPSIHHSSAVHLRKEFVQLLNLHDNLVYLINVLVKLTPAEINILKHFSNGMQNQEIANILFISNTTMKTHVSHILKKFNLEKMSNVVEVLQSTELFSIIKLNNND